MYASRRPKIRFKKLPHTHVETKLDLVKRRGSTEVAPVEQRDRIVANAGN
jgi:hypothetical protein